MRFQGRGRKGIMKHIVMKFGNFRGEIKMPQYNERLYPYKVPKSHLSSEKRVYGMVLNFGLFDTRQIYRLINLIVIGPRRL